MPRRNIHFQVLMLILLACAGYVSGQTDTAQVTGRIVDATGAVIVDAKVTVTDIGKGISRATPTNEAGNYTVPLLQAGTYRIMVEKPGFKPINESGIVLNGGRIARMDFTLEIGTVTGEISVTATAPLVNLTDATQGQVIDNKKIVDMPLNGRNYIELALLSEGTVQPLTGSRMAGFSSGGQRTTQNNYLLDGADNNNLQNSTQGSQAEGVRPCLEAIQEFTVLTNSYAAEFGRATGGVVNAVLKSGSNQLHGVGFGFLRNEVLDAKNYFDQRKPPFKRSQFGFALGGPVIRNKTFFFGDYEGTRLRQSRTVNSTIPTTAMRTGNFSNLSAAIYDPLTYAPSSGTRQPFSGNLIPDSRIDAVSRHVAAWLPEPQNAGLTQNFLYNPPNPQDENKFDVRVDHVVSSKDNIYFRFSRQIYLQPASPSLPPPASGSVGDGDKFTTTGNNMVLAWNHIFSPTWITSSRVAWNEAYSLTSSSARTNYNAEIGLKGVDQNLAGGAQFSIAGYTAPGGATNKPNYATSQARQLINDTTAIRGNHSLKFGVNITWIQRYLNNPRQAVGAFSFNGNFTNDLPTRRGGNSFADFLLGIPYDSQVATPAYTNLRAPWYALYVQDQWRVSSRLTLSLGVRYELHLPFVDTRDRVANFDEDTDPSKPQFVVAKKGSRFDRSLMTADPDCFAPRVGFAYKMGQGTVLRGGYGIYYGTLDMTDVPAFNPPFLTWVDITTDSIHPAFFLRDGVPPVLTPERVANLQPTSYQSNQTASYSHQWNFSIGHTLRKNWLVEAGYYGSPAHHLVRRWDSNYTPVPGPGNINSRRRWTSVVFPGTNITVSPLASALREQFDGNSSYHSLQAKVEKRFAQGFTFLASYLWSKALSDLCGQAAIGNSPGCTYQNSQSFRSDYGLDNQNIAHRYVGSIVWELPLGRARRWGSQWNRLTDVVLGRWSLASIVSVSSGLPLSPTVNGNPANTNTVSRPNVVGNPNLGSSQRTPGRWFNTAALVPNQPFTYGNAGHNILTAPGVANVDFATYKRFTITEKFEAQFRFEAFNFFNTPQFGFPNATLGTAPYGQITSAGAPRRLQFGLKLLF
jgi:hypothetical protein